MITFKEQLLSVIAEWLNDNGIYAKVESSSDGKIEIQWINFRYQTNGGSFIAIVDGGIRIGGCGKNNDIPLALPDSLERLVAFIKSER